MRLPDWIADGWCSYWLLSKQLGFSLRLEFVVAVFWGVIPPRIPRATVVIMANTIVLSCTAAAGAKAFIARKRQTARMLLTSTHVRGDVNARVMAQVEPKNPF